MMLCEGAEDRSALRPDCGNCSDCGAERTIAMSSNHIIEARCLCSHDSRTEPLIDPTPLLLRLVWELPVDPGAERGSKLLDVIDCGLSHGGCVREARECARIGGDCGQSTCQRFDDRNAERLDPRGTAVKVRGLERGQDGIL